jgi:hypothetical protein
MRVMMTLFGYELTLLVPPLLAIGVPCAGMLACFFKALWPRARTGLAIAWLFALAGFVAGHFAASALAWSFLAIGDVQGGPALLGALLALVLAPR